MTFIFAHLKIITPYFGIYLFAGKTIAGTTDSPINVTHLPAPQEDEIKFILSEVKNYLSPNISVRRGDVEAAWSGIRPLVTDPNKKDTQSIARNHIIVVSEGKLVTIAGGRWGRGMVGGVAWLGVWQGWRRGMAGCRL